MSIYRTEFDRVALLSLSMWNRDPASPSFGSFDRLWWGWKFKDLGDATLQYATRLAIGYAERTGETSVLPDLLGGWIEHFKFLQHRDGSFDQCYPNERTPGVIYDILSTLVSVRQSQWVDDAQKGELDGIMRRAVDFSLRTDEKHGEVANHIAEFAYELLNYSRFSGDEHARRRGERYLERLIRLFDREEGWFHEYHGPDTGYQTRTLRYLTKCASLLDDAALWDISERAAAFVGDMLMPDGSVHPMLGVRSTALVYPSAFEVLARRNESFRPVADRIRFGWEQGRVPLPSSIDFQNAIRLADDAGDAADIVGNVEPLGDAPPVVPTSGWRVFQNAGLATRRTTSHVVSVGIRLGGPVVIYEGTNLKYEDAGYLFRSGNDVFLSRGPGAGQALAADGDAIRVRARFRRSLHDEVTPFRMVVLRLLNMTVLRIQWIADLFRKIVVARLMGEAAVSDVTLEREIRIDGETCTVADRISGGRPGKMDRLFRCRRITGLHMASSRYFQPDELRKLDVGWCEGVEWKEAEAASERRISLSAATGPPVNRP